MKENNMTQGMRFIHETTGSAYMLADATEDDRDAKIVLVCLATGARWRNAERVKDQLNISKREFKEITGTPEKFKLINPDQPIYR